MGEIFKNTNSLPATFEPINCRLFKNQFSNYIMTEDVNVLALKLSQKQRQKNENISNQVSEKYGNHCLP